MPSFSSQPMEYLKSVRARGVLAPRVFANWTARAGVTQSAGAVSSWLDQAGMYAAIQATSTAQPIYQAAGWDGTLPCLVFDGLSTGGDFLDATGPMIVDSWVFVVMERGTQNDTAGSSDARPFFTSGRGMGGSPNSLYVNRPSADPAQTAIFAASAAAASGEFLTAQGAGKTLVFAEIKDAISLGVNGGTPVSGIASSGSGAVRIRIGGGSGSPRMFAGKIAQILVVDPGSGGVAERQVYEGRLAWDWGMQASLPAGHPYRNSPPPTGAGPLAISGAPSPASVGDTTAFAPTITGGAGGYSLSVSSGSLPANRSLNGLAVMGTYNSAGSYTYALRVVDAAGNVAVLPVSQTVATA